jgi:MFS family permease
VSRWFEKRRGIALGLAASGGGAGGFLLPPLFQFFIERLGWIDAYAVLGFLSLLVVLPVSVFLLKESPGVLGLLPDGEAEAAPGAATRQRTVEGLTWPEARKTLTFWLLAFGFFFVSAAMTGSVIHLVPFLTDRGMTPPRAALYVSLLAGASLLGRLISGYMADRWIAKFVAMIFFSGAAAGLFILWLQPEDRLLSVAVFAIGLAFGAEVDLSAYLAGKSFGLASFGEIYSYIYGIFVLGAVVGPAFAGMLFDQTGSYQNVLLTFFAAISLSALFMGPTRSLAEITSGTPQGVPR